MIGAIGSKTLDDVIMFECSNEKVLTFDNFVRDNSVRFAKNDVLEKKPVSQFVGPDLDKISFRVELLAQYGVNPRDEMDKLIELQRVGELLTLVIGRKPFGVYRWRIVSLKMAWKRVDDKGALTAAALDIVMEEYL